MGTILVLANLFVQLLGGPVYAAPPEEPKHRKTPPASGVKESPGVSPLPGVSEATDPDADEDGLRPEGRNAKKERTSVPLPGLSSDACEQKHSIETFVQIAASHRPQVTSKGTLYFTSDLRQSPQIYRLERPRQWPEQISFFPDGVAYFSLSPDGLKILAATDTGGDEAYQIYLIDLKTHATTALITDAKARVESIAWGPKSNWFAFTSNKRNGVDFDLYRYELSSRSAKLITELEGANSVTDISPDEKRIAITLFRSIVDSEVLIWSETVKGLMSVEKALGKGSHTGGLFSADSKHVFLVSDLGKEFRQLVLYALDGTAQPKPFTSGKGDVDGVELDPTRKAIVYTSNEGGFSRVGGFEVDSDGGKRRLLLLPKLTDVVVGSLAPTRSQGRFSLFYSRSSATKTTDILQWTHPKDTQWTNSTQAGVKSECLGQNELVSYPSFDELLIPAFLYRPRNVTGQIPFVVYVHGGPEAQFRPGFNKVFQYFLERGYGVFAPNVRGSSGYGRTYTLADNYQKRMDSVRDLVEGAKWLVAKEHALPGKLGLYGGSYGGFMVLRSIQIEPELFAAASESVGIANFVTFLKNTKPYRRALREAEYGPLSDEKFLKSISPIHYLDAIKTPLLVFHGANDPRVPASEAEMLTQELKRRSIPVETHIFGDEGHGNKKLSNIMEQAKRMVFFFDKHLR